MELWLNYGFRSAGEKAADVAGLHKGSLPPPKLKQQKLRMPSGGGPRRKSELKIQIESIPEGRSHVDVLCFDLVYFTRPAQFVILSAGVFFFYLVYGYYQELIFSLPGFTGYGWYLTLIQFGYYSIFGKIEMLIRGDERKVPLRTYTLLALTTVATMGFSNASLGYLNYPTQVLEI